MKVGYIRVSTQEQNTIRQEVLMQALGVEQVFIDRMSGKNLARRSCKSCWHLCGPAIASLWSRSAGLRGIQEIFWS